MFTIEDDFHAEVIGNNFDTFEAVLYELRKISKIPFSISPNKPPCIGWKDCLRDYYIIEYAESPVQNMVISRKEVLLISADELKWLHQEND